MSRIRPVTNKVSIRNSIIATTIDLSFMRPDQEINLFDNVFDAIDLSIKIKDNRIIMVEAPTGSGKSTIIVKITIPTMIKKFPGTGCIVYTSPDSGCVEAPYKKFRNEWDNKVIKCDDGTYKRIRVRNKDLIKMAWELGEETDDDVVDVWFVHTKWLGQTWIEYRTPNKKKKIAVPDFVLVDEIHYGFGTVDATTVFEDSGRHSKNVDPKWLNTISGMASHGSRVIGYTGTPTKSQQGLTGPGAIRFNFLPPMIKNPDTSTFSLLLKPEYEAKSIRNDLKLVHDLGKAVIETDNEQCTRWINEILPSTWEKIKSIGIEKMMAASIMKSAQKNAKNGLPLKNKSHEKDILAFTKALGADFATSTSDEKKYVSCMGDILVSTASDIIDLANDKTNYNRPLILSLMMQGNMGWDITRIKHIVWLTNPTGYDKVTNMQVQTMGRPRLPFGIFSHLDMATKIADLDVSNEQKELVARYVVFHSTSTIIISNKSPKLEKAFENYSENTYTPEEGLKLYLDEIANTKNKTKTKKSKQNVSPKFSVSYSANKLNQLYKKNYCECCSEVGLIDKNGKTRCENDARLVRANERGYPFNDSEWNTTWFSSLILDHRNGNRTDYNPSNLITRCGTSNQVKTFDAKDYLNSYDKNGNFIKG